MSGWLRGVPMYQRAPDPKRVLVTIVEEGKPAYIRLWTGWRVAAIRRAARAHYPPTARLRFGVWF